MGTGVIFGVVALGFLAYVVPWFISRQGGDVDLNEDEERFASSMTLIRRGTSAFADSEDPLLEVSTPMTRRAALADVVDTHRRAALRRRRTLLTLLMLTAVVAVLAAAVPVVPFWAVAIPGGLTVAFLVVARFSVITLHRQLDERVASTQSGWEDDTIVFEVPADLRDDTGELSIELSAPIATGSLWESIPVTPPTYISKPLAPRTVRTIDLSTPMPAARPMPVTAEDDIREDDETPDEEMPRAVNE